MEALLKSLQRDFPKLRFTSGTEFCWSPAMREIVYRAEDAQAAPWSLLHETGHALLEHTSYALDFELIQIEIAAWQKAQKLAERYNISIDNDHIEDCLDSYRDWLHRRSLCASCGTQALQIDHGAEYRCHNCQNAWHVSPSRFCRPYRQGSKIKQPAIL